MVERIKEIPVQQGIQSNGEDMKAFTYRVTGALRGKYNYKGGEKMGSLPCRKKKKKHIPGTENRMHKGHKITKEHGELVKFYKRIKVA